jgi:hypothetical protein
MRLWRPKAGEEARKMLKANGFKRAGSYIQGGRVLSEDYFNHEGIMMVINYSYVKEGEQAVSAYRSKVAGVVLDEDEV